MTAKFNRDFYFQLICNNTKLEFKWTAGGRLYSIWNDSQYALTLGACTRRQDEAEPRASGMYSARDHSSWSVSDIILILAWFSATVPGKESVRNIIYPVVIYEFQWNMSVIYGIGARSYEINCSSSIDVCRSCAKTRLFWYNTVCIYYLIKGGLKYISNKKVGYNGGYHCSGEYLMDEIRFMPLWCTLLNWAIANGLNL